MTSLSFSTRPVVVGAGIGGLAVAIGLQRAGHDPLVLERRSTPSPRGSGLVLSPNGLQAARALCPDLADSIREAGVVAGACGDVGHRSQFLTARGRPLVTMSFDGAEERWGEPIVSLSRATLHTCLHERARQLGVDVRMGASVTSVDPRPDGVAVGLRSGEVHEAELLIGADGVHSRVRGTVLDDGPARFVGYAAVRGVGPRPAAHPDGFLAYGRGAVMFAAPVDDEQLYWVVSFTVDEGQVRSWSVQEARRRLLQEVLAGWEPVFRDVVEASDPSGWVHTDVHDRDPVNRWSSGRMVLLGDAAHPMVYTMGQGANQALEGAATLAHGLTTMPNLDAVLTQYHARVERVAKVCRTSRMLGVMAHLRNPVLTWARNTMMRLTMGSSDSMAPNDWLFRWSLPQ